MENQNVMEKKAAARAYLSRGIRMEERLRLLREEIACWQEMMKSVSAAGLTERVCTSRSGEAPFVGAVEKLEAYQNRLQKTLENYLQLRQELSEAIAELENPEQQLVLQYRYLCNFTWPRIAELLHADERTIRRWHSRALELFQIPETPAE